MYALVEINGKQYKAEKGSRIRVDKLPQETGEAVEFSTILLTSEGENVKVGAPYVEGASIKATVEEHVRDKKVQILKFKRRKNYRRTQGHRQQYTLIRVEDIQGA